MRQLGKKKFKVDVNQDCKNRPLIGRDSRGLRQTATKGLYTYMMQYKKNFNVMVLSLYNEKLHVINNYCKQIYKLVLIFEVII